MKPLPIHPQPRHYWDAGPKHGMHAIGMKPMVCPPDTPVKEAALQWRDYAKPQLQKVVCSIPTLELVSEKGISFHAGDMGLSFAKVITWAGIWAEKMGAYRATLVAPTWLPVAAGAAIMSNEARFPGLLAIVLDADEGVGFAWSRVMGKHDEGTIDGYIDGGGLDPVPLIDVAAGMMVKLKPRRRKKQRRDRK